MTNDHQPIVFVSPTLYSYDSKGKVRSWRSWAEGDVVYVSSGLKDGKKVVKTYKAKPKNVGRSNETTAEEQAILESKAKWTKQLDKNYHLDLANYVPLENPMLAYPYKDKKHKLVLPCYAQPKLDGVRCLIKLEGSEVVYKSRGNKLYTTLGHLDKSARMLLEALPEGVMLDGEIYCHGMPLNEINSAVKKLNGDTNRLQFYWYDITETEVPYKERLRFIEEIHCSFVDELGSDVVLTDTILLGNLVDVGEFFSHCIMRDYEGIMLRNAEGKYTLNNRSVDLQKYKEFDDDEFMIIGYKLDKDGRIVLICESKCGHNTFDVVPKGGHKFREQILEEYENKWKGKLLKVQFQGYGVNGVPIFPVGLGLRETDEGGNVL